MEKQTFIKQEVERPSFMNHIVEDYSTIYTYIQENIEKSGLLKGYSKPSWDDIGYGILSSIMDDFKKKLKEKEPNELLKFYAKVPHEILIYFLNEKKISIHRGVETCLNKILRVFSETLNKFSSELNFNSKEKIKNNNVSQEADKTSQVNVQIENKNSKEESRSNIRDYRKTDSTRRPQQQNKYFVESKNESQIKQSQQLKENTSHENRVSRNTNQNEINTDLNNVIGNLRNVARLQNFTNTNEFKNLSPEFQKILNGLIKDEAYLEEQTTKQKEYSKQIPSLVADLEFKARNKQLNQQQIEFLLEMQKQVQELYPQAAGTREASIITEITEPEIKNIGKKESFKTNFFHSESTNYDNNTQTDNADSFKEYLPL